SFAAIIFRDPAFHPYLGPLSKLVLVSSVVHQCCFSLWSSMPFAVGQVSAGRGLIFLSAMASAVAARARAEGRPDAALLATGGRPSFAPLPLLLRMPFAPLPPLFGREEEEVHARGIAGGIGILFLARRIRHMLTLPLSMFGIVLVFYIVMFATGNSVSSMRDYGWFSAETASVPALDAWEYLDFSLVHWQSALPLVGLSNFVSGLAGGFTGSYIFSQTLFNLRMGVG
ncbi:unnamed protein product, partial [Heterosigma akashiwo]